METHKCCYVEFVNVTEIFSNETVTLLKLDAVSLFPFFRKFRLKPNRLRTVRDIVTVRKYKIFRTYYRIGFATALYNMTCAPKVRNFIIS